MLRVDLLSHTAASESYNQEPQSLHKPGRAERWLSAAESLLYLGTAWARGIPGIASLLSSCQVVSRYYPHDPYPPKDAAAETLFVRFHYFYFWESYLVVLNAYSKLCTQSLLYWLGGP